MRFTLWALKLRRHQTPRERSARPRSGLDGQHAPRRGLAIANSGATAWAVGYRLATTLYKGAEPGLDVRQSRGHQGTVPVIQPAASTGGGGALGPVSGQCAFGVTPTDQPLQALEVQRMPPVAAEGSAIFVNAENPRNASLPFTSSTFQGCNVVSFEVTVLTIEQGRKLVQRLDLFAHEAAESFAALCLIHVRYPALTERERHRATLTRSALSTTPSTTRIELRF
jgi:hypothetical protein